ncbi:EST1-DNA-bind domain containing protein, partial [Pyrenophora tritici-repentis]
AAIAEEGEARTNLASDHWQALIALHRTLLHEHHDFFLASQHPSSSPELRRLAAKYSMPARMWMHGIYSFLKLLQKHLPESIDHMLAFIYLAYQMVALLYETVPAFEDTWIECLGDLGRFRMAIEDEDVRDRETWAGVARSWYIKAADKNPTVGRLYHHLAILARPHMLLQMYYYSRSLASVKPFQNA